jgi:hypothetical protein
MNDISHTINMCYLITNYITRSQLRETSIVKDAERYRKQWRDRPPIERGQHNAFRLPKVDNYYKLKRMSEI